MTDWIGRSLEPRKITTTTLADPLGFSGFEVAAAVNRDCAVRGEFFPSRQSLPDTNIRRIRERKPFAENYF